MTIACNDHTKMENEQTAIHGRFVSYFEKIFNDVELKTNSYVEFIQKNYLLSKDCANKMTTTTASSIYLPKSALVGPKLNCLNETTTKLESDWKSFYEKSGYVSWQYVYDDETKSFRIHPPTNPLSLYGDDLTFDSFNFFTNAVEHIPLGSWSNVRDDSNGTGKIIIFSRALKLNGNTHYTVVGIDVRLDQVLRAYHERIANFASEFRSGKCIC